MLSSLLNTVNIFWVLLFVLFVFNLKQVCVAVLGDEVVTFIDWV